MTTYNAPVAQVDEVQQHFETGSRAVVGSLLAALMARDADTYNHSRRTLRVSLLLGSEYGLDQTRMMALEFGALLHDVGKIGVPDAILRKPGKLNDIEWAMMRRHPDHGWHILQGLNFLEAASRVVVQHHENWDGTGYPVGLRGEEIDMNARILIVADAFDAMTNDRIYRPARSYEAALAELERCAGTQFDPDVVATFQRKVLTQLKTLTPNPYLPPPRYGAPPRARAVGR